MIVIGEIKSSLDFQLYRLNVITTHRKPKQTEEHLSLIFGKQRSQNVTFRAS